MKTETKRPQAARSLTATLAIAFLALSVVVLLISGGLQIFSNIQTQQATIAGQQQLIAQGASRTVSSFIQEKFSVLETSARLANPATASPEDQKQILESLLGPQPAFRQLVLLNAQDQELAKASRLSETASGHLADQLKGDALAQIREGKRYISPVYVDPVTSEPLVIMAVPATNALKEFQGTLAAEVNLKFMWDLVDQLKVGETGLAYVVDRQGNLIAFSDTARVLKGENVGQLQAVSEFIRNPTSTHATGVRTYPGIKGATVVGTYVPLETPDWAVVTELPWEEAYREVILGVVGAVGTMLVMAVLAGLVGAYLARRLAVPLVNLTGTATRIAGGEMELQAVVGGPSEVASLATAFNSMTQQLRDLINSLETRVEARTAQLRASAEVGRAASTILDPQELLQRMVNLICERFGFHYAGVFLLDRDRRFAVLRAGRGEAGRTLLDSGHQLEVGGQSMVGWVCANKQARIALDVGQDAVRFANPLLPSTRSEIALPLQIGERILGALDVQSEQEAAFDESSIAVLQGVADQIAIALENARLFAETQASLAENRRLVSQIQASLQETAVLYEAGQAISTAPNAEAVFQAIVGHGLKPEIDLCLLVIFEPYAGEKPDYLQISHIWTREPVTLQVLRAGTHMTLADFPLRSLLTAEPSGIVQSYDPDLQQMWRHLPPGLQSIAFVPLIAGKQWIGAVGLGASGESTLNADLLKPYQSLAAQAAVAIENHRLIESAQARLQELSTLYRQVTREAWQRAVQSRPTLTELDYAPAVLQSASDGTKLEIPLTLRGEEIGVVELTSADRPAWTDPERALVEAVVAQAALALDSARLFDETQRLAGRERLINEITARIRATASVSAILQTAARELAQALNVPHAVARIQTKDER